MGLVCSLDSGSCGRVGVDIAIARGHLNLGSGMRGPRGGPIRGRFVVGKDLGIGILPRCYYSVP